MIDWFQAVVLAVLQGLTEFLPVSSSAHLLLPSLVLGWPDQGLAFDVAVHVGTLSAVIAYYRDDLLRMARRWLQSLGGAPACDDSRLVWYLALATVPAGVTGVLANDFIETHLRIIPVLATTTLVFGLLLAVADYRVMHAVRTRPLTLTIALLVGLAQALSLIPGVSRSGITLTMALFLGMGRQAAARFSFLLSIPIIVSAGSLKTWELATTDTPVDWALLGLGVAVSGVSAYLCIAAFLRLLDKVGLMPFVYYRIVLAAALYWLWLQ